MTRNLDRAQYEALVTSDGFGIYAGIQHPKEVWGFLKFLIGDEYDIAMARANFLQLAKASHVVRLGQHEP